KVTSTGAATPTTSPDEGVMAVTARSDRGPGTAAKPTGAEPTMATAVAPTTTSTYRTALRNSSIPSPTYRPAKCILVTQSEESRRQAVTPRRNGSCTPPGLAELWIHTS